MCGKKYDFFTTHDFGVNYNPNCIGVGREYINIVYCLTTQLTIFIIWKYCSIIVVSLRADIKTGPK